MIVPKYFCLHLNAPIYNFRKMVTLSSILSSSAEYKFCVWNTFGMLESTSTIAIDVVHSRSICLRTNIIAS